MFTYRVYGLTVQSRDSLPGLLAVFAEAAPDLFVEIAGNVAANLPSIAQPDWQPLTVHTENQQAIICIWTRKEGDGVAYLLQFQDGIHGKVEFVISPALKSIWVGWTEPTLPQDAVTLLIGPVLGCVLRLRGQICLHGAVIGVGRHAIALLGDKGVGKSTTTAALAQRGHPVLADDGAVLVEDASTFWAQPGYPRLRLWPETIETLLGPANGLARVFVSVDKRYIEVGSDTSGVGSFQSEPLPLSAIYLFQPRNEALPTPELTAIPAAAGLIALLGHTFPSFLRLDQTQRARELACLSRLASSVPLRLVRRPDDLRKLPELCDLLIHDASQ